MGGWKGRWRGEEEELEEGGRGTVRCGEVSSRGRGGREVVEVE